MIIHYTITKDEGSFSLEPCFDKWNLHMWWGFIWYGCRNGNKWYKSLDCHYALCIEEWFDISPWGSQKQQIMIYAINMNMVPQISYFETYSFFNVVLCVHVVILNECFFYCIICVDNYERTIGLWWCLNHNVQYGYIQHC